MDEEKGRVETTDERHKKLPDDGGGIESDGNGLPGMGDEGEGGDMVPPENLPFDGSIDPLGE